MEAPSAEDSQPSGAEPALGLQQDDVVRLVETGELGLVEHVGGDTSEEEEEELEEEDDFDGYPIPHWAAPYDAAAPPGAPPRHFIDQYDDEAGPDSDTDSDAGEDKGEPNGPSDVTADPEGPAAGEANHDGVETGGHLGDDEEDGDHEGHAHYHFHIREREEVPVGSARVMLLESPRDVVLPIEKLRVEDRAFATGDVVHRSLRYRAAANLAVSTESAGDDTIMHADERQDGEEAGRGRTESNSVPPAVANPASEAGAGAEQSAIVMSVERRLIVRRVTPRLRPREEGENVAENEPTFEISSDQLSFFCEIRAGCYVVLDDWLGRVMDVRYVLTVKFPSGAVCLIDGHPEDVLPADVPEEARIGDIDSDNMYYPGQYVRAPRLVWEQADWEVGSFRNEPVGQVQDVRIVDVSVDWIATRYTDEHSPEEAPRPPDTVKASEVSPLTAFRNLSWRVGARGLYNEPLPEWVARASANLRSGEANNAMSAGTAMVDAGESDDRAGAHVEGLWEGSEVVSDGDEEWIEVDGDEDHIDDVADHDFDEDGEWEEVEDEVHRAELEDAVMNSSFENEWVETNANVESAMHPPVDVQPVERRRRPPPPGGGRLLAAHRRVIASQMEVEELPTGRSVPLDRVLEVVNTRTFLDLMWQDGTISKRVPAVTVLRNNHLGAYDYFPGIFVSQAPDDLEENANDGEEAKDKSRKNGVVVRVNPGDRTATVRWQMGESSDYGEEEEVSVYELSEHGEYDIRLTDTVLRVPKPGTTETTSNRRDWVGEVVGTGIGTLRVAWHGGSVEEVAPDCLLVVIVPGEEEDEELEGEVEDESYESENGDESMGQHSAPDDPETVNLRDNWEGEEGTNVVWAAPGAANRRSVPGDAASTGSATTAMTALAGAMAAAAVGAGIIATAGNVSGVSLPSSSSESSRDQNVDIESTSATEAPRSNASEGTPGVEMNGGTGNSSQGEEDVHEDVERFEMMDSFEGHHFESGGSADQPPPAGFPMIVRKEWSRLARHLPSGIFVHACENRLDILRAAIIGPSGTPYENVLFFFDIQLPPDYPTTPPRVHFMSHGRRMSPNLYETGKVCLSLLGTWDGDGVEKWDPRNSNLLRVLLSIQAMVLVEEPYYTEAGYEKQVGTGEGKANSLLYNESTMLLTLRHIVSTLRTGGCPADFEEFTKKHYAALRTKILARCEKLLDEGVAATSATEGASGVEGSSSSSAKSGEGPQGYSSVGFKRSLTSLLPRVRAALDGISAGKDS